MRAAPSRRGWIVENCPQCRNDLIRPCGGVGESDTAFADRECKIIIAGGRERCTDLRRPQKLLELDDCRSSRRTGRERFPQDVLRFAQRVFEDDCGIHRFSVRFPARMNCPPLQRSFSSIVKPAWNHQPIRRRQSAVWVCDGSAHLIRATGAEHSAPCRSSWRPRARSVQRALPILGRLRGNRYRRS